MAFPLTNAELGAYAEHCGFPIKPKTLRLFGIRGARPYGASAIRLVQNDLNLWNDTIGVWGTDFAMYLATVDPGLKYTEDPMNAAGAAHLLGIDEGGKPWKMIHAIHHSQYPCLGQGEAFTVRRDSNKDGDAKAPEPLDTGFFAIQWHAGGSGKNVGAWSAACTVCFGGRGPGTPWNDLWAKIIASGQTSFEYFLMDGVKLATFLKV